MNKLTVAIYAYFAHGHYRPLIPIVKELIFRGANVYIFYSNISVPVLPDPRNVARLFQIIGANTVPISIDQAVFKDLMNNVNLYKGDISSTSSSFDRLREGFIQEALLTCPALISVIREIKPDIMLYDKICFSAGIAAREFRMPTAMFHPSYAASHVIPEANPTLGSPPSRESSSRMNQCLKTARDFALSIDEITVDDLFSDHPLANLVFQSKEFHPMGDSLSDRYKFVGPQIDCNLSNDVRRDTIYVSLGTLYGIGQEDFFRVCIDALSSFDNRVVISVGEFTAIESLLDVSQKVEVCRTVDQLEVLSRSEAFINHGGMNSVQESIILNVPMVVVPQAADQFFTSRRVTELDCGLSVEAKEATAPAISDAVNSVIKSTMIKEGLLRQRSFALGAGGPPRAVDEILSIL